MFSVIVTLIVNTIAFLVIAKFLPGFKVGKPETAVVMAGVYGILSAVATAFAVGGLLGLALPILVLVPLIGPLLVICAAPLVMLIVSFGISVAVLMATDHIIEDFEMDSPATTVIASVMLAVISAVLRGLLFGGG